MNYLAIDTSGDLLVALNIGDNFKVKHLVGNQTKHSLTLMPYIEQLLSENDITLSDIDFFAVVIGPGSFTGIRIGISTIKALCYATGKKVLPLTSFDLLAYANNSPERAFCVVDANHDNYYSCAYEQKKIVLKECFLSKEQILQNYRDFNLCAVSNCDLPNLNICDVVSGMKNAVLNKANDLVDESEILPLYVKRSQAEEERC